MQTTNIIAGGMATVFLAGVLLLGGCTDQNRTSPTAQVDQAEMDDRATAPRSPMSDVRATGPMAEPYAQTQESTFSTDDDERTDRSLADGDVAPMNLPELNSKVEEVKNTLSDMRLRAERNDELDDYKDLQHRTNEVAQKIIDSGPQLEPEDQQEISEEILEVEAEVAEFDNELSEDL